MNGWVELVVDNDSAFFTFINVNHIVCVTDPSDETDFVRVYVSTPVEGFNPKGEGQYITVHQSYEEVKKRIAKAIGEPYVEPIEGDEA